MGDYIRLTVPGSVSVNISKNRGVRVKAGKENIGIDNGNGTISENEENILIEGTLQMKTVKLNGRSVHISGVDNSVSKR